MLTALAYAVIRSGNSAPAFKAGAEQSVRNALDSLLIVRPRFKEFAVGHPLLLVGCWLATQRRKNPHGLDARPWLWAGMIGPISMINTFCHFHSPLHLMMLRSGWGLLGGGLVGMVFIRCIKSFQPKEGPL